MLSYFSKNKILNRLPYQSNDFLFRWKKIQRIIAKENLDGLLLIAGPDGNDNLETVRLINWLFLGYSGQMVHRNSYLPQHLHEVIILISKNSNIFLTPKARHQLSEYIYSAPSMQVFCPTEKQFQNRQVFDVLKISQFYRIVKDHKKIGVLSQVKAIQKWPLIQSFALEQVGGAFFTMKYQVQDLTQKVQNVYKNHDKHSLKTITQITCKRMLGYMKGVTSILENTDLQKRSTISQQQLNEPLKQAIQIQLLELSPTSSQTAKTSVLVGVRTNEQSNHSSQTTIDSNLHMTVDYSDPYTELRVCRTFFFSNGNKLDQQLVEEDIPQQDTFIIDKVYSIKRKTNTQYKNLQILLVLYSNLIESTLQAIIGITKDYRNLNTDYIKSVITSRVSTVLKDIFPFFPHLNIEVQLFSYNSLGQLQKVDFKDIVSFKLTPHYHIVKTLIKDIPSQDNKTVLGSVKFSQSFVLQEGCYLLLTRDIPYLDVFNCHSTSQIYNKLNPNIKFQELGQVLQKSIPQCRLFLQTNPKHQTKYSYIPVADISINFHQNGFRIFSQKLGWIILTDQYIKEVTLIDNIDGYWVQIELIDALVLGEYCTNNIILGLKPKAQQIFTKKIANFKQPFKFTEINETPVVLAQNDYFLKQIVKQKDMGLINQSQVMNNQFLFQYLQAKQLMILNNMRDLKLSSFRSIYNKPDAPLDEKELSKHHILVVNGAYASGKNRFATNLLRYSRQNKFNTSIFTIHHQNLPNKLELPTFIQMLSQFVNQQPSKPNNLTIVVVPCWINSKQFLDIALEKYHIRCVCTKINASNFYSTVNYQLTENTLTYTTSGYSQLVFLDTFGQDQSYISEITNIIWNYSPHTKLYNIANNSVTSAVARDVYSCSKFMKQSSQFLRSKHQALYQFDLNFQLKFVEIRVPVRTQQAIKNLKEHEGYLYSLRLLQMELQKTRKEAETSKDELLMILYKVKERISIQNRKGLSMRLRCLKGTLKFVDEKQTQEITWTNLFYKQKPNKNQVLGLSVLSTKWNQHQFQQFIDRITEKDDFFKKMKQPIMVENLTKQQIKAVQKENRGNFLQNGQFFDGSFFRDCEGTILKSHPKLPQLLNEYVQGQNISRMQFNKSVMQQWEQYKNSFNK